MSTNHEIRLRGPAVKSDRLSGPLFQDLLHVLVEGTQRAVRLKFDGKSKARGTQPGWLKPASQFDLLTVPHSHSSIIRLSSRPLSELLHEASAPAVLSAPLSDETGLDLFEDGLEDALAGVVDSDRYDEGLVETFSDFARLFDQGLDGLDIVNGRTIHVLPTGIERVQYLRRQTPPPQAVRIAGKVDAIRHSDRMFTLIVKSNVELKGYADKLEPGRLAALFGQNAIVSGTAVFRPSGSLLRLDADQIEPAAINQLQLWDKIPTPILSALDLRTLRESQGPRSGINAIIGQWPGDESDDEIRGALESLS